MAHIKVDCMRLLDAAQRIEEYISKQRASMKQMDNSINSLSLSWKGQDYTAIQKKWQNLNVPGSTSELMIRSLKNYSDSIRDASAKYRSAQDRAVSRANSLCKWGF